MDFLGYIKRMKWWERLLILNLMMASVSILPYLVLDIIKGAHFEFFWDIVPLTGSIGILKATVVSFFYERYPVFLHRFFHVILVALLIFAIYWIAMVVFFSRFLKFVI